MQNQVFEKFMCPFGPGFEKVYVPILAPIFKSLCALVLPVFRPNQASGWSKTDSPKKKLSKNGVNIEIRAF